MLSSVKTVKKYTKAPKHFNEVSILAFMENPKAEEDNGKLVGLGTAATRHTFIPKLLKSKYIELKKQDIVITEQGNVFIEEIISSQIKNLANISETTKWEKQLEDNPEVFLEKIKEFISKSVSIPLELKDKFSRFQSKTSFQKKRRA